MPNSIYTQSSYFFDFQHPDIQSFVDTFVDPSADDKVKAVDLYNAVRDGWYYNAYKLYYTQDKWKASDIVNRTSGNCLDKSILLVSCLRAINIPARLHLAKVKNHIAVEKLIEKLGCDELTPHGMVDIYLNDKWVKASPAFNSELCDKLGVAPLDFNGEEDSIFQQYSKNGSKFMEYIVDYGHFVDVPWEFIWSNLKEHYQGVDKMFAEGINEMNII